MDAANVDAVIGICSARHSSTFIRERDDLIELKKNADKPVVLCSYTLPREGSVEIVNRCGCRSTPICGTAPARSVRWRIAAHFANGS